MIAVSTRALMATLAIGVTLPSDSMRTGTGLRSAMAVSTGTTRAACACERAALPSVVQNPRTSKAMPIRASAATPKSHFRLFIGNFRSGNRWALPGLSLFRGISLNFISWGPR